MTNKELSELISFDKNILFAEILSQNEVEEHAVHVVAKLTLENGDSMIIPFVWYEGENWIFTPWDWQSSPSTSVEDIDSITWRVNDSEREGVIINGLPRLL